MLLLNVIFASVHCITLRRTIKQSGAGLRSGTGTVLLIGSPEGGHNGCNSRSGDDDEGTHQEGADRAHLEEVNRGHLRGQVDSAVDRAGPRGQLLGPASRGKLLGPSRAVPTDGGGGPRTDPRTLQRYARSTVLS